MMRIGDMDHSAVEDGSTGDRLWIGSSRIEPLQKFATLWWEVAARDEVLTLAIKPVCVSPCSVTETYCTVDDRLEHWLDIGRRLADHAQDLAGCRLLLQRLGDLGMGLRERLVLLL